MARKHGQHDFCLLAQMLLTTEHPRCCDVVAVWLPWEQVALGHCWVELEFVEKEVGGDHMVAEERQ